MSATRLNDHPGIDMELALGISPSDSRRVVILARGELGYRPFPGEPGSGSMSPEDAASMVAHTNARWGLTPEMAEAYMVGSMFGWDVPGARAAFLPRGPRS